MDITYEGSPAKDGQEPLISDIWKHALFIARQGLKVFPLRKEGKRPLSSGWQEKATTDESVIKRWALQYPDYNYGVVTGEGFFVIDPDFDGIDVNTVINRLQEKLGMFKPGTIVETGRCCQLYCDSGGYDIRSHAKRLMDDVDVKGAGGYVVGPGSVHPNGKRYQFYDAGTLGSGIKLTKLSDTQLLYIKSLEGGSSARRSSNDAMPDKKNRVETRVVGGTFDYKRPIPVGVRNDTLFRIGCYYRERHGLDADDIYAILKETNSSECEAPLPDSELRDTAESCSTYPAGTPRSIVESSSPEECSEETQDLFQGNKLIDLFRRNVQKFHVGDEAVTELLMLSLASMSVANTSGIQPKLSGESGMGKTHSTKTVLHLMHPTVYRAASFSSKALFYDDKLRPKMVIFSDDVNLAPDVEETVRAAMTNWDSPTEHITLDGKRNPVTLSLPPRVAFWLTSVDNKSTIQLQNRQVEINVDETPDQDKRVEEHQRKRAALGLSDFYVDSDVEVLRKAFLHINQVDFNVKIPFIRNIKFTNVHNRRNFPIFLDFIKAYCVLNYRGRENDEEETLVAMREDFDNALGLFKAVAVQQVTKLNERERQVAAVIKEHSPCDVVTILGKTKLSRSRVSELLHGDRKSGNGGMLEKIPELRYYSRFETDEDGTRWGKNHYSLPEDWSIVASHESIVYWDDDIADEDELNENPDQFRSVSECFGAHLRNSSESGGGLDGDLDPIVGGCSTAHTTYFGTSVGRETPPTTNGSSPAVVPDRNIETAPLSKIDTSATASKRGIPLQSNARSVSGSPSETARNAPEPVETNLEAVDLDHIIERVVTAIEDAHNGRYIAPDRLVAYVANEVQKINSSFGRVSIHARFLELVQQHEEISRRVDLITRGESPK